MLINRVKIYTNLSSENNIQSENESIQQVIIENTGNKLAMICCILNCTSPISESKDYKTLTKVFEKLMLKIENVFVVNIKDCKSSNFIHFIHDRSFRKIFIFGEDATMANIPIPLKKFEPKNYELYKIMLAENLNILTESSDLELKAKSWESIKAFYKL